LQAKLPYFYLNKMEIALLEVIEASLAIVSCVIINVKGVTLKDVLVVQEMYCLLMVNVDTLINFCILEEG